jgi:FixJ family two-component response regulator
MSPQQTSRFRSVDASPESRKAKLIAAAEIAATENETSLLVCLLDDDPSVLKATRRLLLSAGWKVESFTDPVSFLHYAKSHHPRVVVIDIRMPIMNGLEVQKRLHTISPDTRVLVLTSKDEPSVRDQALQEGASGFFLKPVHDHEFLAGIESASRG